MNRLLIAFASVTVLLGACGEASPQVNPRDAVLDAMTAVYQAGTMHQEFEMSVSAGEQSFSFRGEADVDNARQRISMTVDLGMLGGSMDMVMSDGVIYMRSPMFQDVGTEWVSMDPSKLDPAAAAQFGGFGTGSTDPSSYVGLFAGVIDVEAAGEEQIAGVSTTHYVGTIDLRKVIENFADVAGDDVPKETREQLEFAIDQLAAIGMDKDLPFEIWIDREGYPRRQKMTMDFGGLLPGAEDARMEMTADYSDFGEPVDIDVPRPSQVTDVTKMLGAGGGAGGASGASSAYG
jgi:hypothetical protein